MKKINTTDTREVKNGFMSEVDRLTADNSFSLLISLNPSEGLTVATAALGLNPDFRAVGRHVYRLMEKNEEYGRKFAELLEGIDAAMEEDTSLEKEREVLSINMAASGIKS